MALRDSFKWNWFNFREFMNLFLFIIRFCNNYRIIFIIKRNFLFFFFGVILIYKSLHNYSVNQVFKVFISKCIIIDFFKVANFLFVFRIRVKRTIIITSTKVWIFIKFYIIKFKCEIFIVVIRIICVLVILDYFLFILV